MGSFGTLLGKTKAQGSMKRGQTVTKEHSPKASTSMAKDPMCGMETDEKSASAKSEYMGKTYYFCSSGCKKAFDADPAKYAGGGGHEMVRTRWSQNVRRKPFLYN